MCQSFLQGPLQTALDAEGVAGIMDFTYYPFGNAYYNTQKCHTSHYDKTNGMYCWIDECGGDSPSADCFTAPLLCQHGTGECETNLIMACAVKQHNFTDYMPFVQCLEGDNDAEAAAAEKCAKKTGLNFTAIDNCVNSQEGVDATVANAQATVALGSSKLGVPWVIMEAKWLEDSDSLLQAICEAYQGEKPAGCSAESLRRAKKTTPALGLC